MSKLPRGIRNNNPGNLRHGNDWQGLKRFQLDADFCQFTSAHFGIRALFRVLMNYQRKHRLMTIRKMIYRWAPPIENETDAYVDSVAKYVGVDADKELDICDPTNRHSAIALVHAIIRHENGQQPYTVEEISKAIEAAGA